MPDANPELTLALVLTAGGLVVTAALITGLVQLLKTVVPIGWSAQLSRTMAFILSAVIVTIAYVTETVEINAATAFGGFLAWYGIARLALATYDDVTAKPNSLRGPVSAEPNSRGPVS